MKKIIFPLLMSGFLMVVGSGCNNDAKTSSNAPNTTADNTTQNPTDKTAPNTTDNKAPDADVATNANNVTKNDAQSEIRRNQLNSDIRAREQRNNAGGNKQEKDDGDLESQVRSKLEANIPNGQLTVDAKDGAIIIAGTVQNKAQLDKIPTLAKEIKGVGNVTVKASVAPGNPQ